MAGKLFICATPIGNLEDITLRVLNCLKSVDLIAAEDTRHTLGLLNHYDIKAALTSYHEHNKYEKAEELIAKLHVGTDIALVTDAGTPAISDPGEVLVKRCLEEGICVTSLPGASAVITALSMSGLSTRRFFFEGFLPTDKKERSADLAKLALETATIVIYEAPHRIKKTLADISSALGNRNLRICRELTKIHEEVLALTVDEAIKLFETKEPKGEMVVLIEGADSAKLKACAEEEWKKLTAAEHVRLYTDRGMSEKEAMKLAASERGISRREIYDELKVK